MTEPACTPLRLTPMKRALAVTVTAFLVLAGCGSADQGSAEETSKGATESGAAKVGSCASDSQAVTGATAVTKVDLDGDHTTEQVMLTAAGGACGNTLFAETANGYVTATAPAGEPPATTGFAIASPGHDGQLLVTKSAHPRGGFQLHVYAADGEQLTELTVDGQPLIPFVATDVQEHPFSIDCADGGFVTTDAVPHEPAGFVAAWDITRTSYTLEGARVTAGPSEEVADNVLPGQLGKKYPELAQHAMFESCRA